MTSKHFTVENLAGEIVATFAKDYEAEAEAKRLAIINRRSTFIVFQNATLSSGSQFRGEMIRFSFGW